MINRIEVTGTEVDALHERLSRKAESAGYHINPDRELTQGLIQGLLVNEKRYGYRACPCRLAGSNREEDLDIICPCDYRDPDLVEFGACYCALYISEAALKGQVSVGSIPERRLPYAERLKQKGKAFRLAGVPMAVWRCNVCGYLCARNQPPEICPICKVKKDRFEIFLEPSR